MDPGPLGRRAEPGLRVREELVRERVRANLLAGVTPSEAAIVEVVRFVPARHRCTARPPRGLFSEFGLVRPPEVKRP